MNNNNMNNKSRKFVYSTGSNYKKQNSSSSSSPCVVNNATNRYVPETNTGNSMPNVEVDDFELALDFDDDDITNAMSAADLDRLEIEATKKLGLYQKVADNLPSLDTEKKKVEPKKLVSGNNIVESNSRKVTHSVSNGKNLQDLPSSIDLDGYHQTGSTNSAPGIGNAEFQQLSVQLEQFKSKVHELESCLCERNGELKILRSSLEEHRQGSAEKSEKIMQLKINQHAEQSQRETSLAKEVASLQTKLSFQEQELMEQSKRVQSQKKGISVSGGVKRKAELATMNSSFDLDNSFIATQQTSAKKMPRISETNEIVKDNSTLKSSICLQNTDKPVDLPSELQVETYFAYNSERTGFQLVKNLILFHSPDSIDDDDQNATDSISLLHLLKYPLKHLPKVLEAHAINTFADKPSQFPLWQSQKLHVCHVRENSADADLMDMDSGKYGLVTQGIFSLLGLHERSSPEEQLSPSLGVTHILVFLELYISSYLFARESRASRDVDDSNVGLAPAKAKNDPEWERSFIDGQNMVVLTLRILSLLFKSVPSLVKHVLERTDASVFACNDDVIIIDDDLGDKLKNDKTVVGSSSSSRCVPGSSNDRPTQEHNEEGKVNVVEDKSNTEDLSMGSFLSLLLQNLEKLIVPDSDDSLLISHAALDVLVAMTSFCEKNELERVFLLLKRGCLLKLLAKDSGRSTVLSVMSLLKNFLPCNDVHKLLCSRTDDCILLKIYQCACEEDDEDISDAVCRHFLLQVVQFLKSVAFSHSDSIEFLLQTYCQCSLEIIRCLVLILQDKVNYLLELDPEAVTSDKSLIILRIGFSLLVVLCTHRSYSVEHKLDVEHHYIELIYNVMILYKNIKDVIPEVEALGVQDLLDNDQIDEIEWSSQGSDDDEEFMEIDA